MLRLESMCSLLCQRPLTLHFACTRRIGGNYLYAEGGKAIAAVLKDTQITTLQSASTLEPRKVLAFVSAPLDITPLPGIV